MLLVMNVGMLAKPFMATSNEDFYIVEYYVRMYIASMVNDIVRLVHGRMMVYH